MSLPVTPAYVRYADGVEEIQPNEDQLTDETVASMARLNRYMFEKHRHAIRDAHAKSHGVLRGELHIYPQPARAAGAGPVSGGAHLPGYHPVFVGAGRHWLRQAVD